MNRQTVARTLAGNPATATRSHTPAAAGRTMSQPAGTSKTRPSVQGGMFRQWQATMPAKRVDMGGMNRQEWMAANPALAAQFRDWRRGQMAAMPQGGQGGPAWTQTPYSKHFVDMLPNLVERAFMENYSPAGASSFDWNDPRDIKRAAQYAYVDMQPSYYRQNAMGGGRPSGGAFARNLAPQPNGITWPRSKGALPPPTYPSPLIGGGG